VFLRFVAVALSHTAEFRLAAAAVGNACDVMGPNKNKWTDARSHSAFSKFCFDEVTRIVRIVRALLLTNKTNSRVEEHFCLAAQVMFQNLHHDTWRSVEFVAKLPFS